MIRDSVVWLPTALAETARYRPVPLSRHGRFRLRLLLRDWFARQHRFIQPCFALVISPSTGTRSPVVRRSNIPGALPPEARFFHLRQ